MALEDKRKHYGTSKYLTLTDLATWEQYCKENQSDLPKSTGTVTGKLEVQFRQLNRAAKHFILLGIFQTIELLTFTSTQFSLYSLVSRLKVVFLRVKLWENAGQFNN